MNKDELQLLAQQKELEWKAINEKRIEALEREYNETIKTLEIERKNFYQLKEDFKYNLKLLDERDKELSNIENYYNASKKQLSEKEGVISDLKIQIDELKKYVDKENLNLNEAKRYYLERLNEKQLEIDNYKLIKDAEITKERLEIENHKRSLQNHIESLKYDLERQRNELKTEFDEVMRKREHEWRKSYDEQSTEVLAKEFQIKLINSELDQLKEANRMLKQDHDDIEMRYKTMERELKEKQWELKDNTSIKDSKIQELEAKIKENEVGLRKQIEEFKQKIDKMDKVMREKDVQIQALKEVRLTHESEKQKYEERLNNYKNELKQKEVFIEKFIEEKGQLILNLNEEILRLKTSTTTAMAIDGFSHQSKQNVEIDNEHHKKSFNEIKADFMNLKAENKLNLKYLNDYKLKLEKSLEREQQLEKDKLQVDLDWQKKYHDLEKIKFTTSEEYLRKLSDSRDQALAQIRSLEEKLKQKEAIINAMKSANPALDTLNTEVHEMKFKEENEYLKQIIKQMREEIETLANDIPFKGHQLNSTNGSNMNSLQVDNRKFDTESFKTIEKPIKVINEKHDVKVTDNTIINEHIETLNQKISLLRKEKLELTSHVKKQQIRLMHVEKQVSSLTDQSQSKQAQIETLQYELNSQTRRHTAEVNSLKQRIAELELELNESHKEADEYHKSVIQKESEIATLELKVSDLKLKLSSTGTQINFGAQELFIQQLQDEIERLNKKILSQNNINSNAIGGDGITINELNYIKEIKNLKSKLKTLAKHVSQLIQEKQQLIEMSNQLRAELDKTRKQYDDVKLKTLNKQNYIDHNDRILSAPVHDQYSTLKNNQLKKLEDIQYNLTKKDLAYANIKNAQSNPELMTNESSDKTGAQSSSFTSDNENKTLSSVKSENLKELWKILDENALATSRSEYTKNRGKTVVKAKSNYEPLSARGEKMPLVQSKTAPNVTKKPKIRNYNVKD